MHSIKIFTIGFLLLLSAACSSCVHVPAPPAGLEQSLGEAKIFDYHGVRINYYAAGQGPPVILLHGFGASAYSWRFMGPALAADHRVLTLDLKGYGLSAKPEDGKYAISDQADMVAEFIRTRDLRDLVVIGHSMGGGVTLMTYFKVREDEPGPDQETGAHRQRRVPSKDALVHLARQGAPARFGGRQPGLAPVRRRPGAEEMLLYKDRITDAQIDTYAYYSSLPGAREAVVATAEQIDTGGHRCHHRSLPDHQGPGPDYLGGGGRGGAGGRRPEVSKRDIPRLANWSILPQMRPYPPGRGAGGDHPYRRGLS